MALLIDDLAPGVDSRLAGKSAAILSDLADVYSATAAGSYLADVRLDWWSRNGPRASLITPRHAITAAHTNPNLGSVYGFRTPAGVHRTATLAWKQDMGGDLMVLGFTADVADCVPVKVFPADVIDYLANPAANCPLVRAPAFFTNQFNEAHAVDLYWVGDAASKSGAGQTPVAAARLAAYAAAISGDSANPIFCVLSGEPVLVYALYQGGNGDGPAVHCYLDAIRAEIWRDGLQYDLTVVDLSAYTKPAPAGGATMGVFHWNGTTDNTPGTAANYDESAVPTSADTVILDYNNTINSAGGVLPDYSGSPQIYAQYTVQNTNGVSTGITLTGLTVTGALTVATVSGSSVIGVTLGAGATATLDSGNLANCTNTAGGTVVTLNGTARLHGGSHTNSTIVLNTTGSAFTTASYALALNICTVNVLKSASFTKTTNTWSATSCTFVVRGGTLTLPAAGAAGVTYATANTVKLAGTTAAFSGTTGATAGNMLAVVGAATGSSGRGRFLM